MLSLYMDVHVHGAITRELRARGVDILTVQEDHRRKADDEELMERAKELKRLIFTHDDDFLVLASTWQRSRKQFTGIAYGKRQQSIGKYIGDLELIAKATELEEWANSIIFLPF